MKSQMMKKEVLNEDNLQEMRRHGEKMKAFANGAL